MRCGVGSRRGRGRGGTAPVVVLNRPRYLALVSVQHAQVVVHLHGRQRESRTRTRTRAARTAPKPAKPGTGLQRPALARCARSGRTGALGPLPIPLWPKSHLAHSKVPLRPIRAWRGRGSLRASHSPAAPRHMSGTRLSRLGSAPEPRPAAPAAQHRGIARADAACAEARCIGTAARFADSSPEIVPQQRPCQPPPAGGACS